MECVSSFKRPLSLPTDGYQVYEVRSIAPLLAHALAARRGAVADINSPVLTPIADKGSNRSCSTNQSVITEADVTQKPSRASKSAPDYLLRVLSLWQISEAPIGVYSSPLSVAVTDSSASKED
jgi:hypothetical protein